MVASHKKKKSSEVWSSEHLSWLVDMQKSFQTLDGKDVKIFELKYKKNEKILSAWARHLRNHYCRDDEIDDLRCGFVLSRCEYLKQIKFPDGKAKPGPSIRAGDFGEILVADYVEYILNYVVPRTRYLDKDIRNESKKGIDVIGFKQVEKKPTPKDGLITFEVKCALSKPSKTTLKRAIVDSCKDFNLKKAESLNAIKQRLRMRPDVNAALITMVERFQNKADRPYKEISGASAIHSNHTFNESVVGEADASFHPNRENIFIIVIRGREMIKLVHDLYRRAANEA